MNSTKKRFSIGDYIFCKAYNPTVSDRGRKDVAFMESLTSNHKFSEFFSPFSMRALTSGSATAGGNSVGSNATEDTYFGGLYSDSYFLSNATILDNLTSDIKINTESVGTLTKTAVTETTTAAGANVFSTEPAFSAPVTLTPHFIRVSIKLSSTLIETSSVGIDTLIINSIRRALAEEVDRQIIRGVSSKNEITGLNQATGINTDTWGTLTALTGAIAHTKITTAEQLLGTSKVPEPYEMLINSKTRNKLRAIRQTGYSYPILTDDNRCVGRDVFVTENLEDSSLYLLNPEFIVAALWHDRADFDLIVDSFSEGNKGNIILTMSVMADAAIAKPKALSVITAT